MLPEEKELLKRYLNFMDGFTDSGLYKEYKKSTGFSDDDYDKVMELLNKLSK